jgi:hypothetical protein
VRAFVEEEYNAFPVGLHDDMLDALSRMEEPDLRLVWPLEEKVDLHAAAGECTPAAATAWMA